jgi:hydroxymethylpyrimidine pyrophosphatase-like HAD family hydrolase
VLEPHLALEIVEFLDHGQDAVLVLLDPEPTGLDYLVTAAEHLTANTRWWFDTIGAQVRYVDRPSVDDMHHALRVGLVAPPVRMPPIQQSLEEHFGSDIFVQHFMGVGDKNDPVHVLEVFATGVSKWAGLQWLAERRDIEADQVAAIGDEINDVQMIAAAGCGVAMGNAVPAVRQVARYNTATNDEAGVARAIDNMLAGRW